MEIDEGAGAEDKPVEIRVVHHEDFYEGFELFD